MIKTIATLLLSVGMLRTSAAQTPAALPAPSSALINAAQEGDAAHMRRLLRHEPANAASLLALYNIDHWVDPRWVSLLCAHGAKPTAVDAQGRTALHLAALKLQLPSSIPALIKCGADVNARDQNGDTPLHLAMEASGAQALIKAGADLYAKNRQGLTPLHLFAARYGEANTILLIDLMLAQKVSVNIRDAVGRTPLSRQAMNNPASRTTSLYLINLGADVNAQDDQGNTPVDLAREARNGLDVDVLMPHGGRCHNTCANAALANVVSGKS